MKEKCSLFIDFYGTNIHQQHQKCSTCKMSVYIGQVITLLCKQNPFAEDRHKTKRKDKTQLEIQVFSNVNHSYEVSEIEICMLEISEWRPSSNITESDTKF
jgi:hypothetical protein